MSISIDLYPLSNTLAYVFTTSIDKDFGPPSAGAVNSTSTGLTAVAVAAITFFDCSPVLTTFAFVSVRSVLIALEAVATSALIVALLLPFFRLMIRCQSEFTTM